MPFGLLYRIVESYSFVTNSLCPLFVFCIPVNCPLVVLCLYSVNAAWAYNYMIDLSPKHSYIVEHIKIFSHAR